MRSFLALALAIVLGTTWAVAQRHGMGAGPSAGGFRGGVSPARPQTFQPSTATRNIPSSDRTFGSNRNAGGFGNRNASGLSQFFSRTFSPDYLNPYNKSSSLACNNPLGGYSPNCAQYLPNRLYWFGGYPNTGIYPYANAYPFMGYYGDPYGIPTDGYGEDFYRPTGADQQEMVWVQGNPPRADALDEASAFHRVAPRDVRLKLDGAAVSAPEDGSPLTIGSGSHTLQITAQSKPGDETAQPDPPKKNPIP